jgi:leucine-zipper of insertion element IS481/Excalibur calcium-binding domain
VEQQRTVAQAAAAAGVSVRCARKWTGRYRAEGEPGLRDRSSAPHRIPHRIDLPTGYGMQYSTAYNCSNFGSRGDAQDYLYLYPSDPSRLDADHDGLACEDLPGMIYPAIPAEPTPPTPINTPVTTTTPITTTPVIPTKPPVTKTPKPAKQHKANPPALPTLSQTKANSYLRTALQRRFGSLFWKGSFQPRCKRWSRTAFSCRPGWYQGDFSFAGRARIWLAVRRNAVTWNYSWRIQRLNTYCSQVQHRHSCTRIYRVQ